MNPVIKSIQKIQRELHVCKDNKNTFGNYSYRNIEEICQAIKPLLEDGVICYLTETLEFNNGRHYIGSHIVVTDGTTEIKSTSFAREPETQKGMNEAQITGASTSYARKYVAGGLFLIDNNKDFDSVENVSHSEPKPKKKIQKMAEVLCKALINGDKIPIHKWDVFRIEYYSENNREFKYMNEHEFIDNKDEIIKILKDINNK